MDWSVRNRDLVAHHIIENAKSGDIVLLHDPYDTSVEAAPRDFFIRAQIEVSGLRRDAGVGKQLFERNELVALLTKNVDGLKCGLDTRVM